MKMVRSRRAAAAILVVALIAAACDGSAEVDGDLAAPDLTPSGSASPLGPRPSLAASPSAVATEEPSDAHHPIDVSGVEDSDLPPPPEGELCLVDVPIAQDPTQADEAAERDPTSRAETESGVTAVDERDAVDVPDEDELGVAVELPYENELGQQFTITAVAADEELAREALSELRICLEAVEFEGLPDDVLDDEETPDELELEEAMVAETVAVVNALVADRGDDAITAAELARQRNEADRSPPPTLRDLVAALDVDADAVLEQVIERLAGRYPTEVNVEELVKALWHQADAPYLEALQPDEGEAALRSDISDGAVVLYEFELAGQTQEEFSNDRGALLAHIDPSINEYPSRVWKRVYRAKCRKSAWARVRASDGSMTLFLWRKSPDYKNLGSRYAHHNGPRYPRELSGSSRAKRSYDIRVEGRANGSYYDVYGWWSLGGGGGC